MSIFHHNVFGLNIESEIELPELNVDPNKSPQIYIKFGKVPANLAEARSKGVLFEAAPNDFIFCLKTIGRYRVQNGEKITVDPISNTTNNEIRLFLLGSVIGALLFQRGFLPIHSNAISTDLGAVLIMGHSAAGKSTISAKLYQRGFKILCDDLAAISSDYKGEYIVHPGIPQLKLWKDVLHDLGENGDLEKVRPTLDKYWKKMIYNEPLNASRVKSIILLRSKNSPGFSSRQVHGTEKIELIKENIYRYQFIEGLGLIEPIYKHMIGLAKKTDLFIIERPTSPLLIEELSSYIEAQYLNY